MWNFLTLDPKVTIAIIVTAYVVNLLIVVAIIQWVFRVNHICRRLDEITALLQQNTTKKAS